MKNVIRQPKPLVLLAGSAIALAAVAARAQTAAPAAASSDPRIEQLQKRVEEQGRQINALKQSLAEQEARQRNAQGSAAAQPQAAPRDAGAAADTSSRAVRVGVAPSTDTQQPPAVAPIFDQPGILTPKGRYVLEPSVQYGYSSSNRVALVGYTVIPALLIGLVDVREVKRNTLTGALTGRWGLTNRLEVEAKLPYVYRSDSTISRELFTGTSADRAFEASGKSIGDVEFAARYQLNQGQEGMPYMIGSLRFKTRTGKDPFEVVTDCVTRCVGNTTGTGLPLDLPTGSGFYSLQPGLTWLFPSDPAVFFGGISYTHNFSRKDVRRQVLGGESEFIGKITPGGVLGLNFGMGLALNDRSSFSVGVDLNSVGRTKLNGETVATSVRTQLSSLLLGYSYRYSARTNLNVSVGAGLTRDTPDLTLSVRVPMLF
jgi:hypothetical protein